MLELELCLWSGFDSLLVHTFFFFFFFKKSEKKFLTGSEYQVLNVSFQFGQLLTIWKKKILLDILSALIYPPRLALHVCLFLKFTSEESCSPNSCLSGFPPTPSAHCPWGSPIVWQPSVVPSFLLLLFSHILLCKYTTSSLSIFLLMDIMLFLVCGYYE